MSDTLGDLKTRDIDNLEYLLKNKQTHTFVTLQAAFAATGEIMRLALLRIGFDLKAMMDVSETKEVAGEIVQEAMDRLGIKIEPRKYGGIDEWRSGLYIYKGSEIVAFIGGIKKNELGASYFETTESRPAPH